MPVKLNLKVTFDLVAQVAKLEDISSYAPNGYVEENIGGYFKITYPDGIEQDFLTLQSPLLTLTNNFTYENPLRLDAEGRVMRGGYRIEYVVKYEGNYLDTLIREVNFDYETPVAVITPQVDLFTPDISVKDDTDYNKEYFTHSLYRTFSGKAPEVDPTVLQTTTDVLDLGIGNKYYNTTYQVKLDVDIIYTGKVQNPTIYVVDFTNDWFSVKDNVFKEESIPINREI